MIIDAIYLRMPDPVQGIGEQYGMPIGIYVEGGHESPLYMNDDRRCSYWNDKRMMPAGGFGREMWEAVDATCRTLWGEGWQHAVSEIWGINRRTLQRDRVMSNLLPPRVLRMISTIASMPDAKDMASALFSYARIAKGEGAASRWALIPELFDEISTIPEPAPAI
ncbi:MAG: hypothetical protein ABS76_26685 [Pelagibacterium sp. SCN 64-44]|jgi:hypothetical protein|nr:MAG: hypothetical protein ABS76_26685 [Pelagibacterium sp. SCN 64-44]